MQKGNQFFLNVSGGYPLPRGYVYVIDGFFLLYNPKNVFLILFCKRRLILCGKNSLQVVGRNAEFVQGRLPA